MSLLNDHLKLVRSPVCSLLFSSCGLLFSPRHSICVSLLFVPRQWLRYECCVWRGGDETLLGGGHAGVTGGISFESYLLDFACSERRIASELYITDLYFLFLTFLKCIVICKGKWSFSLHHTRTHSPLHLAFSLCFQLSAATSWHACWLVLCAHLFFTEPPGGSGAAVPSKIHYLGLGAYKHIFIPTKHQSKPVYYLWSNILKQNDNERVLL